MVRVTPKGENCIFTTGWTLNVFLLSIHLQPNAKRCGLFCSPLWIHPYFQYVIPTNISIQKGFNLVEVSPTHTNATQHQYITSSWYHVTWILSHMAFSKAKGCELACSPLWIHLYFWYGISTNKSIQKEFHQGSNHF